MFAKFIVAATLVSGVYSLTVASPASLVQCQPVQLSWSQGTAPFYVSIIPGGQPSAAALESFPTTSDTQMTWVVDLSSGTSVTVKVVDSTGDTNYSSQVTVQAGSTTQCSSSSGAAGAGSASAASSPSAAATTAAAATRAASSKADDATSSAGAMVTSVKSAASAGASSVTSGIGAAAASASKSATGAASSVKASSALVGSFVAGAAMLYALA